MRKRFSAQASGSFFFLVCQRDASQLQKYTHEKQHQAGPDLWCKEHQQRAQHYNDSSTRAPHANIFDHFVLLLWISEIGGRFASTNFHHTLFLQVFPECRSQRVSCHFPSCAMAVLALPVVDVIAEKSAGFLHMLLKAAIYLRRPQINVHVQLPPKGYSLSIRVLHLRSCSYRKQREKL